MALLVFGVGEDERGGRWTEEGKETVVLEAGKEHMYWSLRDGIALASWKPSRIYPLLGLCCPPGIPPSAFGSSQMTASLGMTAFLNAN